MKYGVFNLFKKVIRIVSNVLKTPVEYRSDYMRSMLPFTKKRMDPLPWMNYKSINFIGSKLPQINTVFEYGSGSSTLFWLNKGKSVISIEHDPIFYQDLHKKLVAKCYINIHYHLIEPEIDSAKNQHNPALPHYFHSADFNGYSFRHYVDSINSFNDETFDVVVVDGRARPACISQATRKIKCGGLLVLDNSDRGYYLENTADLVLGWERHDFVGTVRGLKHHEKTSFFIKP